MRAWRFSAGFSVGFLGLLHMEVVHQRAHGVGVGLKIGRAGIQFGV